MITGISMILYFISMMVAVVAGGTNEPVAKANVFGLSLITFLIAASLQIWGNS